MSVFPLFPALQLPLGKTTVMHLVARENLPEPNNQGKLTVVNIRNRFTLVQDPVIYTSYEGLNLANQINVGVFGQMFEGSHSQFHCYLEAK